MWHPVLQCIVLFCFSINIVISVIPFDFSPSSQVFPLGPGIDLVLLKNAFCVEESQRGVKKVHFLLAILTTDWLIAENSCTCLCAL